MTTTVLSLGGSIIAPDKPDKEFLSAFYEAVSAWLDQNRDQRIILVCGGGAPARDYQEALRTVRPDAGADSQDWLGIRATHLNGALVRAIFSAYVTDELVTAPLDEDISFSGQVLVAAGWKPGFSTDTDAVYLARRFGAKTVINLSNIEKVYTDDPRKNPDARPVDHISWDDFIGIVGTQWTPGRSTPFDPVASALARESGMSVICAGGRNIANTMAILNGREYTGTTIG